ncbi:hypothetical protein PMAYCL1PPCAC_09471, partial [Pristionchus mayeri]
FHRSLDTEEKVKHLADFGKKWNIDIIAEMDFETVKKNVPPSVESPFFELRREKVYTIDFIIIKL